MFAFFILGREPKLSTAEIAAVYGSRISRYALVTNTLLIAEMDQFDAREAAETLGGSVKYGTAAWYPLSESQSVAELIANRIMERNHALVSAHPELAGKKILFAVNGYQNVNGKNIGLEVKGILQREGHTVRSVVSREPTLSAVSVVKEKLLDRGADVMLAKATGGYWIGITEAVQPFEAQSRRDYDRPARDAKRGMIPVQLARILVNLAGGKRITSLLDPFCGIGTVLMEGVLLGIPKATGTDIDPKAIHEAKNNLQWLWNAEQLPGQPGDRLTLLARDARETPGSPQFDAIVTEPFLGDPIEGAAPAREIAKRHAELGMLYAAALRAFSRCLTPGGICILTLPAYKSANRFLPFPKENLLPPGLTAVPLPGPLGNGEPVIYQRVDQFVGREILVVKKA